MPDTGIRVLHSDQVHLTVTSASLMVLAVMGRTHTRVSVDGELDMATVAAFGLAVDHVLATGPPRLEVDLAELRFLSASGIEAFEVARRRCTGLGGWLRLEHVDRSVRRLLTIVGAEHLLCAD